MGGFLALLIGTVSMAGAIGSQPIAEPLEGLVEVNAKVVKALLAAGRAREVLVSASDFFDYERHLSPPLAVHLRDTLVDELRAEGFEIGSANSSLDDAWTLQCRWARRGQRLALTYTLVPWQHGKRGTVRVVSASLPIGGVPARLMEPDMASYGRTLVHRLALDNRLSQPRRVHLRPVVVAGVVGGQRANTYFNDWLHRGVADNTLLFSVDAPSELRALEAPTLRSRGIRPKAKAGMSLTAELVAAESELAGEVKVMAEEVAVDAVLLGEDGHPLSNASVSFPVAALPAEVASALVSPEEEAFVASAPTSKGGLEVELSTTRGEGTATYRAGELIAFLIRVSHPAHLLVFDLDAAGGATLLYPAMGASSAALEPERVLLLPDDGLPYELEVTPPFGEDLVWVVASQTPLELPAEWADADQLMAQVRALGASQSGYAEAQLMVVTTP